MDYDTQWLGGFTISKFYETKAPSTPQYQEQRGQGRASWPSRTMDEGGSSMAIPMASGDAQGGPRPSTMGTSCLYRSWMRASPTSRTTQSPLESILSSTQRWCHRVHRRYEDSVRRVEHIPHRGQLRFIDTHLFQEHQNGTIMPALMLNKAKRDYQNESASGTMRTSRPRSSTSTTVIPSSG